MDASTLRLILLVAGILLVLGIYFWDRLKGGSKHGAAHRRVHRREPMMDESVGPWHGEEEQDQDRLDAELDQLDALLSNKHAPYTPDDFGEEAWGEPAETYREHPSERSVPFGSANEPTAVASPASKLPSMILQINVRAKNQPFAGDAIMRVAKEMELVLGEFNIFHRLSKEKGARDPLFSMASMVEPGVFPAGAMTDFSTPGLTLFAQLPGLQDGMVVFSDMLFTAERIAAALDGELQDDSHSVLTRQTIEHIRSQLLEFRRQLQLAKRKA